MGLEINSKNRFCVSWLGYARIEGEHEVSEVIGEYFPSCEEFREQVALLKKHMVQE
jgi:hypothetical protein